MQPLWKTVWNFLKKKNLKIELPYDQEILLLEIYLKNPETLVQKNICTPMLISSVIYNHQALEAAPSVDEWIKKLWYIYTMEYYMAGKKEGNITLWNHVDYYAK